MEEDDDDDYDDDDYKCFLKLPPTTEGSIVICSKVFLVIRLDALHKRVGLYVRKVVPVADPASPLLGTPILQELPRGKVAPLRLFWRMVWRRHDAL